VIPIRRFSDVLRAAAQTVGGDRKLAAFLDVPPDELHRWLQGDIAPPLPAFLQALDLAARGPYGPRKPRRIRVAVIPPEDV
jgi:hypothetical protein